MSAITKNVKSFLILKPRKSFGSTLEGNTLKIVGTPRPKSIVESAPSPLKFPPMPTTVAIRLTEISAVETKIPQRSGRIFNLTWSIPVTEPNRKPTKNAAISAR